ncbi:MarR family winged helix-turn-helix transcriptional regulator [Streptomyces sp. NPDC006307]|uniref:MarR family winged helix-turn-helix transcriptional regulator n=1 Tax=unclassified Streptomyces TaxID=2593676 RepID=UPI0033A70270
MQPTEPAETSAIRDSLGTALVRAAREHRVLVSRGLTELGLHPGQELLLAELWKEDGVTQTELTARLGVELPTVVKAVQRLEASGLVTRRKDPRDRRVTRVHLTEQGGGLRFAVETVWTRTEDLMLRGLEERQVRALREALDVLHRNLSEERWPQH